MAEFSTPAERQARYEQAERERQALVRVTNKFKAIIDSLGLGLYANVSTNGNISVYVKQADDRMERLMGRKAWIIPADELLNLDDKEKERLALELEKA